MGVSQQYINRNFSYPTLIIKQSSLEQCLVTDQPLINTLSATGANPHLVLEMYGTERVNIGA